MRSPAALAFVLLLAACGQTGDLYLPQKVPPASTPAPEEQDQKKGQVPSPAEPEPAAREIRPE